MRINYSEFSYQRKQLEPYFNDFVASVFYFIKGLHEDVFEQNEYEELDEYTERINEFNEFIKSYLEELDDDEYCTHFDAFYEGNQDKEEPLAEAIWEAFKDTWDDGITGLYMDDKGNLFKNAAEYCKEYDLPLMTEYQLIETGDLMHF